MKSFLKICCCMSVALLAGCIKNPKNSVDPYEKMNRVVFAFNVDLDHLIVRPVTKVYSTLTPPPLQKGVTNAYANIRELTTLPNDILQGKIRYAFVDFWRFAINSTFGIGGLFDVASHLGLPKHVNDFGLTLAYWEGYRYSSPYLMLPIIGPSTFRDGFGEIPNYLASPWPYIRPIWVGYAALGGKVIDKRSQYLADDKLLYNAFDPYVFLRDAYLQHRSQEIENSKNDRSPLDKKSA